MKEKDFHLIEQPVPDQMKKAIDELLRSDKLVKTDLFRLGVLKAIKKQGGEIIMKEEDVTADLQIKIGNVVMECNLNQKVNFDLVSQVLKKLNFELTPMNPGMKEYMEKKYGKCIMFKINGPGKGGPRIIFSESGKFICTGYKGVEIAKKDIDFLVEDLLNNGVEIGQTKIQVQNILQTALIGQKVNFDLTKSFIDESQFNITPHQHSKPERKGIYKTNLPNGKKGPNILLFESGEIRSTGSKNPEEGRYAIEQFVEKLREVKAIDND